jgi:hypothetical protein
MPFGPPHYVSAGEGDVLLGRAAEVISVSVNLARTASLSALMSCRSLKYLLHHLLRQA